MPWVDSNSSFFMSNRVRITAAALLLTALAVTLILLRRTGEEGATNDRLRVVTRDQLHLRAGALHFRDEGHPFSGTVLEMFPHGTKRVAIEIRDGRPHGRSRGWHENGQLEVEEHFVHGTSNGPRQRWYADGTRKSEAHIVNGKIEGTFTRWHENGNKAAVIMMKNGVAHGMSEAWTPTGRLKARAVMRDGEVVERSFFDKPPRTESTPLQPSKS